MKCPHCTKGIHSKLSSVALGNGDRNHYWAAFYEVCPECGHLIIWLGRGSSSNVEPDMLVYPRGTSRPPLPPEVPERFGRDYVEASLVLADSPKASAALSRRTLQNILREKAKVTAGNLSSEIDKVLSSGSLPSYLSSSIDAIRTLGNFAAHPTKDTNTGEIVEVEPGEAEWLLDVLEGLFDFYFVQPVIIQKKKDRLNVKLTSAGKPLLK
ncbi:MAG: hypothetical protein JWO20_97 [Candidatus Angelobacter sp.]|nr:hypothetical protein [Candidatus Angelobacter sp.]